MATTSSSPAPGSSPTCPVCGAPLPPEAPHGLCPRCLLAGVAEPTNPNGPDAPLPAALAVEEIAPHFPQLEIQQCLGRGGMGVVYQARQKSLNRTVALKLLAPERIHDARFAERFQKEAHALAALSHPHIVTVHDFGQAGPYFYLLMEFVDGVNLRQAMSAGRFTPEQALAIVPPVCEALQYAHEHGIVHRDIKPENLLLDKDGRVKIADFGIAKILGADDGTVTAEHSQPVGTPQYMAPEQQAHGITDHRADIYSLGVVLYELLTGELPGQRMLAPSAKVQIDVRLDEVVLRALASSPELRYQTAAEFQTRVETISGDPSAPKQTEAPATLAASANSEPRFSIMAVIGAAWAVFTLPAFVGMYGTRAVPVQGSEVHMGPLWWQILLMLTLLPLGFTAPFGTTILGWMAIHKIRHSAGRISGLGLAVFDALFFPLFVLLPAVGYIVVSLGRGFFGWSETYDTVTNAQLASITCLIWIFLVVLISHWVWRQVTDRGRSPSSFGGKFVLGAMGLVALLTITYLSQPYLKEHAARLAERQALRSAPRMERISSAAGCVFIVHNTLSADYVLYYRGNFSGGARGTSNLKSNAWVDDGSILLPNGRSFGYLRESHDELHLRLNGAEYDLRAGRLFVLRDDGTVEQIAAQPSLAEARQIDPIARLAQEASPAPR